MTDEHGFVLATATTDAHGVFAFGWTTSPPVYFSPAETYFLRLPSQTLPGTAPVSPIMVQFVALSRNDIPLAP